MTTTIRLISKVLSQAPQQQCYWKARWADPWAAVPALWCDFSEWSAAPSLPVANFRWRYGIKLDPGEVSFGPRFRELNRMRFFVKVVHTIYAPGSTTSTQRTWHGVIDIELDDQHGPLFEIIDGGDLVAFATGINHFTAFGVESLLDCQRIGTSLVGPTSAIGPYLVNDGLQFNHAGIDGHVLGNRSATPLAAGGYAFHPLKTGAQKWSTKTIVDYLLRYQTPADNSRRPQIPFVLNDPTNVLPDWDEPVLPQDGRTTRELLNALISRQRTRGHYFAVVADDDGGVDQVQLRPFSFSDVPITLDKPYGARLPANDDQIIIAAERDRGASSLVTKRSAADKFDRVCARGARRTSTATFSFPDGTLDKGWPAELEELYEKGASEAVGYADLDDDIKELRNAAARKVDKLRPVYSRFVLPDPFGYVVGDGLGEPAEWLTPNAENPDLPVRIAPDFRRFLPHLALRAGFDYTDENVGLGTITAHAPGAHHYLEPIVLFRRYDWSEENKRYRHVESLGINAESELEGVENYGFYLGNVTIDHQDGSLWIRLTGDDQHCIAKTDFTPLPIDRECGNSDYQEMLVTATVAWSEYAEQHWPEELPFGFDAIRTLTIDAGDDYRCDHIVNGTAVAVDQQNGEVERSTGGYLRDDRKQLSSVARLAYEWYGRTRKAVTLETTTINTSFELGQLVVSLGDPQLGVEGDNITEDIQSCITSLRFDLPLVYSEGAAEPGPAKLTLQTAFGELDPLAIGAGKR